MDYTYLIIGGGLAADAAVQGIRSVDATGTIGIITSERYPPYNRPLLTKGLWTGLPLEAVWRKTAEENVSFHLETTPTSIDLQNKEATDTEGNKYTFKKLLLATGSIPNRLSCPDQGVIYFRTLDDYHQLREIYDRGESFVIFGGGFIGTELAASLTMNGKTVTLLFPSRTLGNNLYSKGFSQFLSAYYTEQGVKLMPKTTPSAIVRKGAKFLITTHDGAELFADGVIAGLGITPNVQLAQSCGLSIDDGIVVNPLLQTSHPDVFSAGDNTRFFCKPLDKQLRFEHEDGAKSMGFQAGRNMAGQIEEYNHLPYFYSDLFDLGYEAIGEIDNSMEIIEDWHEQYRKGVVYYLRDGYVRGAMLWSIWNKLDAIREMITSKQQFTPEQLLGKVVA